jgi:hypothetical protein
MKKHPIGTQFEIVTWIKSQEPFWSRTEEFVHPVFHRPWTVGVSELDYLYYPKKPPALEIGDKVRIIFTRTETRQTGPRRNRYFGRNGVNINPSAQLDTPVKSRALWLIKWELIEPEHSDMYGSSYENYEL